MADKHGLFDKVANWKSISKYRSVLMGFSILWIFFFHYKGLQLGGGIGRIIDVFFSVGWIGVDIFLFLSAIGCCFSLKKDPDALHFFKRRIFRIIPTWWFFLTFFFILAYIRKTDRPESTTDFFLYYSGIGWWLNWAFETPRQVYYEWYVPTLLLFYTAMPMLYKRSTRSLLLMFIASTLLSLTLSYFDILSSIYCSYQRIPVFILGVLFGKWMIENHQKEKKDIWIIAFLQGVLVFLIVRMLSPFHIHMDMAVLRLAVTLFLPLFCVLLGRCLESISLSKPLSFMGAVTLEVYMLHIYNLPLNCVRQYIGNHTIAVLVTLAICIITAYLVSIMFNIKRFMPKV